METENLYSPLKLALNIKKRAKETKITIKQMLNDLGFGTNVMQGLYDEKAIAFDRLARIADYLDCSVDYLLGRTDVPEINHGKHKEELHQIKIAARGGGVKEITITDSQLQALLNLPEVTDLDKK